jgi:hypothetical protein
MTESDNKLFFRATTRGSCPPSAVRSITGYQQGWDITSTPEWNVPHMLYVIGLLHKASKEEFRKFRGLDKVLKEYTKQGDIPKVDFIDLIEVYTSLVNDGLPYFMKIGDHLRIYSYSSSLSFPFVATPPALSTGIVLPLSAHVCNAVQLYDMYKAKKLLLKWFQLLIEIEESKRDTVVSYLEGIIERKILNAQNKLIVAKIDYQKICRVFSDYNKTMNDANKVNKFIGELKAIQDLSNDLNFIINFSKTPVKSINKNMLDKLKGKIAGGKDKWDVIKAGITMLGKYIALTEMVAYHNTTPELAIKSFISVTERIIENTYYIVDLGYNIMKIQLLGEMNPVIYALDEYARFNNISLESKKISNTVKK